jgi:DNA mismatch repair protein MutL
MIHILSQQVANLIAAGEVVERPASALKEMLENAVDAGASSVTAEIQRGGVSLIRVTDNGHGMSAEDAVRSFMRHATSKIRTAADLGAIVTMGFRGEALAAIAAVSRTELLTRERGAHSGTSVSLEAGRIAGTSDAGCPEGTTVAVRSLFFNTPARQKFLKKDSTEAAAAQEAAVRMALARPDISVRFIRDGSQVLHTPGGGELKNCLYSIFGSEFTHSMLETALTSGGIEISGFAGKPSFARSSRAMQYFFVNGRPVRSRTLTAALEDGYSGMLMSGRRPVCCLRLTMPPDTFDINVHPAKSEIKFQHDRAVYNAVYTAVHTVLQSSEYTPSVKIAPYAPSGGRLPILPQTPPLVYSAAIGTEGTARFRQPDTAVPYDTPLPPPSGDTLSWRLIGEAMTGYLLVETPDALWIIDKHAAHERVLFNRLKAGGHPFLSQRLLEPRAVVLSPQEIDVLLEEYDFLSENGFDFEQSGPNTVTVSAAPGEIDENELPGLLSKLAGLPVSGQRPGFRDDALEMIACKAAVKLGRSSRREDMERLAGMVMETPDIRHCPHGRTIAMRLTRGELGKQFGR